MGVVSVKPSVSAPAASFVIDQTAKLATRPRNTFSVIRSKADLAIQTHRRDWHSVQAHTPKYLDGAAEQAEACHHAILN